MEAHKEVADIRLQSLMDASRSILEHETFLESARAIFDACCRVTGATAGYVALLSEDGAENEVLFLEAGGLPCSVDESLPMPIRGLRAESYHSHRAVYHNDFMNSEWVRYMPEGHVFLRNVMFAPLNLGGTTVGIMGLANKEGDFTDEDAELAAVFGDTAAVALLKSHQMDLLEERNRQLQEALDHVKTLRGLVPICASCKSVRDDDGYWRQVEVYLRDHSQAQFSHSLCPDCVRKLYPDMADEILGTEGN